MLRPDPQKDVEGLLLRTFRHVGTSLPTRVSRAYRRQHSVAESNVGRRAI